MNDLPIKPINPPLDQQVKYEFVRYCRGIGLDLGYGKERAFAHSVGLRLRGDEGDAVPNVKVDDLTKLDSVIPGSCDFLLAADVLSHYEDAPAAVKDWLSRVKLDGHVCIYEPKGSSMSTLLTVAETIGDGLDILRLRQWGDGAFMVLRKMESGFSFSYVKPRPEKTACVVRHGGFGDQLQAAYLLPELKRQGYHITFLTTPLAREMIEHDPHIDEWFMVDHNQVPNHELVPFWSVVSKNYDKFVNLNESVEGTLLTLPGRPSHQWPHSVRHALMNRNYAEFGAMLAEIKFVPEGKFYTTPEEDGWCKTFMQEAAQRADLDRPFVILWVLAGSSPHKFTPHQDAILKMVMGSLKRAIVVMVGNEACRILEQGWEKEKRVTLTSGNMEIRKTLALAQHVDLVVGPETGVMNSVCYADVPKVIMLSHSSHENLTKHWNETKVIQGIAPCYPCHRLHYSSEYCPQDQETHAAICQQNVDPRLIYGAIEHWYEGWARMQLVRSAA